MIKKTIFALNSFEMKKYFGFLICLFVLNACDDGEMTFDTFDFSEVNATLCDNNKLLYKINGNEALVLQINNATDAFPFRNVLGVKTILLNNASNKVYYRTFDGTVTGDYFCSNIPPVSPIVTSEYVTSETGNGSIEITTTLIPSTTTLATAKYLHSIILKNVTFANAAGGTITYDELNFGTYQTSSSVQFAFTSLPVQTCSGSTGKFFKVIDTNLANLAGTENLNKFLEINFPISSLPANTSQPSKIFLNQAEGITAVYRVYNGDVLSGDYCAQLASLNKYEEWKTQDGVDASQDLDDTGYFEISKSFDPDTQLPLYSVTLRKFSFERAFPVDPNGLPAGTFTNSTDINFGTISLP